MGLTPEQRIEHLLTEDVSPRARAVLTKAKNEITALRAQVAAFEQDAARYRWLRDRPWQACHKLFPSAPWMHEGYEANQERMDAAIDAARKEVQG